MVTTLLLRINFTVNRDDLFSVIPHMFSVEVTVVCVKVRFC